MVISNHLNLQDQTAQVIMVISNYLYVQDQTAQVIFQRGKSSRQEELAPSSDREFSPGHTGRIQVDR